MEKVTPKKPCPKPATEPNTFNQAINTVPIAVLLLLLIEFQNYTTLDLGSLNEPYAAPGAPMVRESSAVRPKDR